MKHDRSECTIADLGVSYEVLLANISQNLHVDILLHINEIMKIVEKLSIANPWIFIKF